MKFRGLAIIAAAAMMLASCGGTENPTPSSGGGSSSVTFSVTPTTLDFDADGGTKDITVTASAKPSATPNQSWITRTIGDLSNNKVTITVTAKANTSTSERTAELSLKQGDNTAKVTITQAGKSSGGSTTTTTVSATEEPEALNNEAWAFSKKLGFGWNLGNHFDTYPMTYGYWDKATPTKALFTKLKSYGFSSVRIPVTWYVHADDNMLVEDDFMEEVAEVVGWARDAGLNVILNTHHDDADSKNWLSLAKAVASSSAKAEITEKFNYLWTQIATRFKDEGDYLIFESFNEMHDGSWGIPDGSATSYYEVINYWNQQFVNTVRATGGNNATRMLGVPGYAASPSLTLGYLEIPTEPDASVTCKIAVSIHDYDPYAYTIGGKYDQWGHTAASGKAPSEKEKDYAQTLRNLYDAYLANNIPVYIGECGCANKFGDTAINFKKYYIEYTFKAMKSYGLAGFVWDNNGEGSGDTAGYVNHATGEYLTNGETYVSLMKKAYTNTSSNYTLESVYNSAP